MLAESVYKGVLDNGNFREFLHGVGEFSTFKTGIPGGPVRDQGNMQSCIVKSYWHGQSNTDRFRNTPSGGGCSTRCWYAASLQPGQAFLKLDFVNAFNTLSRYVSCTCT